jgi:hypothetical protein
MATQNELLNKMETLIQELANQTKPKIEMQGPIGTTWDILGKTELSLTQRSILLYLVFSVGDESYQRNICSFLDISMKCVRENCNVLYELNYIKRGSRASTWCLV